MRIAIHQPNFMPRLKVMQKICMSDVFVSLNDVQYCRREWQNRVLFENKESRFYMTVPLKYASQQELILNMRISECTDFISKSKKTFYNLYSKSLYWKWIKEYVDSLFENVSDNLVDFNIKSAFQALKMLSIDRLVINSDHLNITSTNPSDRLFQICKVVGGSIYISGSGGKNYLDQSAFKGIEIVWQDWKEPTISNNEGLYKNLSFICFVSRFGPEALKSHLLNEQHFLNSTS